MIIIYFSGLWLASSFCGYKNSILISSPQPGKKLQFQDTLKTKVEGRKLTLKQIHAQTLWVLPLSCLGGFSYSMSRFNAFQCQITEQQNQFQCS